MRNCQHGCCGNKYEEYCCNVTLQIIGCAIGGLVVLCIIIAVAYYCWRKKTKARQHGGLFGRLGLRSNLTGHQGNKISEIITSHHHETIVHDKMYHVAYMAIYWDFVILFTLAQAPASGPSPPKRIFACLMQIRFQLCI